MGSNVNGCGECNSGTGLSVKGKCLLHFVASEHTEEEFRQAKKEVRHGTTDFPDVSEGDTVTYVRMHGGDKIAVVKNVRGDGHVDLHYAKGEDLHEVKKVAPKTPGNESGYVVEDTDD